MGKNNLQARYRARERISGREWKRKKTCTPKYKYIFIYINIYIYEPHTRTYLKFFCRHVRFEMMYLGLLLHTTLQPPLAFVSLSRSTLTLSLSLHLHPQPSPLVNLCFLLSLPIGGSTVLLRSLLPSFEKKIPCHSVAFFRFSPSSTFRPCAVALQWCPWLLDNGVIGDYNYKL